MHCASLMFAIPFSIKTRKKLGVKGKTKDDFLEFLEGSQRFYLTDQYLETISRAKIGELRVLYTIRLKQDNEIIERPVRLRVAVYLSITDTLIRSGTKGMQFYLGSLLARVIPEEERGGGREGFCAETMTELADTLIPIIHMLWGEPVVILDRGAKTSSIVDAFKDLCRRHLGVGGECTFPASPPHFLVNIAVNCPRRGGDNGWSMLRFAEENAREFYGIAVSDEGYHNVMHEYAWSKVKSWAWGNRWYELNITSPVSVIGARCNIPRKEFEKIIFTRREWLHGVYQQDPRKLRIPSTILIMEWISYVRALLVEYELLVNSYVDEFHKVTERGGLLDFLKFYRKVSTLISSLNKTSRLLEPAYISKIPETYSLYSNLLEYRGVRGFQNSIKLVVGQLEDMTNDVFNVISNIVEINENRLLQIIASLVGAYSLAEELTNLVGKAFPLSGPVLLLLSTSAFVIALYAIIGLILKIIEKRR